MYVYAYIVLHIFSCAAGLRFCTGLIVFGFGFEQTSGLTTTTAARVREMACGEGQTQ